VACIDVSTPLAVAWQNLATFPVPPSLPTPAVPPSALRASAPPVPQPAAPPVPRVGTLPGAPV
jgi:hypothetical protein